MALKFLSCKEVTSRLAHGTLEAADEPFWVRFHLTICYTCRKYIRQLQAITQAFRQIVSPTIDPARSMALKQRLINRLAK